MSIHVTITVKDEEKKKLSDSFIQYDKLTLANDDPTLLSHVEKLLAEFKGIPEDIVIKTKMVWK